LASSPEKAMHNKNQAARILFAVTLVASLYFLPEQLRLFARQIFEALAITQLFIDSREKTNQNLGGLSERKSSDS
jgi:hypothetical protein